MYLIALYGCVKKVTQCFEGLFSVIFPHSLKNIYIFIFSQTQIYLFGGGTKLY